MKINLITLVGSIILLWSCVDDYQDANPPPLLDSPAVSSVTAADDEISAGSSTKITAVVVDAPAGVDSVAVVAVDQSDMEFGSYTIDTQYQGMTRGDIEITYKAPSDMQGVATVTVTVFDRQERPDGEVVRKSSVPQSVNITVM